MMFQTIHTIFSVSIWSWQHVSVNISSLLSWAPFTVYCFINFLIFKIFKIQFLYDQLPNWATCFQAVINCHDVLVPILIKVTITLIIMMNSHQHPFPPVNIILLIRMNSKKDFMQGGADLNTADEESLTPLHMAARLPSYSYCPHTSPSYCPHIAVRLPSVSSRHSMTHAAWRWSFPIQGWSGGDCPHAGQSWGKPSRDQPRRLLLIYNIASHQRHQPKWSSTTHPK